MTDEELEKELRPEVIAALRKMEAIYHTLELIVSATVVLTIIQIILSFWP